MYVIKTDNKEITLKAKARYYREFKLALGVQNLKAAFFKAFDDVDIDFLAMWIKWFNEDRNFTLDAAYDVIDDKLESEDNALYNLFADCAEFLNGMGFFGKRLEVGENERTIAFFEDKMNRISMDEKMADAIDSGMTSIVNRMVEERMQAERDEA
jgi:hypothetical protein